MKILFDADTGVPGVRVATPEDEDQIFCLLMMLHSESGFFSVNVQKVINGIRWATERKGGIIFVINENPDDHKSLIVATLGLLICTDWYSDDEYLSERWTYVLPEHRKSNHARKLLEQAKWTSEWFTKKALEKGRPPIPFRCGMNSFDRTEGKVRLYARHMACMGAFFMYGQTPFGNDKLQRELDHVNEVNLKAHRERSREVVPVVETILRLSRRHTNGNGAGHV